MTKFTNKSFSVAVGSEKYAENWDRVFAKKAPPPETGLPIEDLLPKANVDHAQNLKTRVEFLEAALVEKNAELGRIHEALNALAENLVQDGCDYYAHVLREGLKGKKVL